MLALQKAIYLYKQNGLKYALYRIRHAIQSKSGLLTVQFPIGKEVTHSITLASWKAQHALQQIADRSRVKVPEESYTQIKACIERLQGGEAQWFHGHWYPFSDTDKWLKNPVSGKHYNAREHWSKISTFTPEEDIKYVWDPARFEYVFPYIQWDALTKEDHGQQVLDTILDFIDHAPMHGGPHYVSCQEIAIRLLHWTVCLNFYKDSPALTQEVFARICTSMLTQATQIEKHIAYARNLVRNNHVLSEAAALFTVGSLFPTYKWSAHWKTLGWKIFEAEIHYQFADDGTYLQHAHNYHRMALRLCTWMICAGNTQNKRFDDHSLRKLDSSLQFLCSCLINKEGSVPNYSSNDGTNLLPFLPTAYSDYTPMLNSLHIALHGKSIFPESDADAGWLGLRTNGTQLRDIPRQGIYSFKDGGFYWMHYKATSTCIRCAPNTHRPAQADNLHVDISIHGINVLRDPGVYQYNANAKYTSYFLGTAGHNTIAVGQLDQMLKGPRFIWYFWSKATAATLQEDSISITFTGTIRAFRHAGRWIYHTREVVFQKNTFQWKITDIIDQPEGILITQYWHPHPVFFDLCTMRAEDANGQALVLQTCDGYFAPTYGVIEPSTDVFFQTHTHMITTYIQLIDTTDQTRV